MANSIKKTYTVPGSPEEVFDAMVDAKKIKAWSGQAGSVASNVGGKMKFFGSWVAGEVLIYKPGKELKYTWWTEDWGKDTKPSTVDYKLRKTKTGTKVILSHTSLPNAKETKDHAEGWDEYFFDPLKVWMESQN